MFAPIIELSVANTWDEAKSEWRIESRHIVETLGHCICGHVIKEHILLHNMLNDNRTVVGNVCIFMFNDDPEFVSFNKTIFKFLKTKKLSNRMVEYGYEIGSLRYKDYDFLINMLKYRYTKRPLSNSQKKHRDDLIKRLIRVFTKRRVRART